MAVFIRHIDSDVKVYSGFASMCARHYTFVCNGLTCSTRPFGERVKVDRCWARGSSSDVLGSAPTDTFADLHKGRNRSTSRLWVTQD